MKKNFTKNTHFVSVLSCNCSPVPNLYIAAVTNDHLFSVFWNYIFKNVKYVSVSAGLLNLFTVPFLKYDRTHLINHVS